MRRILTRRRASGQGLGLWGQGNRISILKHYVPIYNVVLIQFFLARGSISDARSYMTLIYDASAQARFSLYRERG